MKPSENAYSMIRQFEGKRLKAYLDPIGTPTIGYGSIKYPDGRPIKMGDLITEEQANQMLIYEVALKTKPVRELVKDAELNQNQFDSLISFAFNLGVGALKKSTLLKKVLKNPNDPSIEMEFLKWVNAGGKVLPGLIKRRQAESDNYFL